MPYTFGGRTAAFSIGQTGDQPYQFTPNALNQQYMPSIAGNSAKDYARMGPGGMRAPSDNAYSESTYQKLYPTGYATRI